MKMITLYPLQNILIILVCACACNGKVQDSGDEQSVTITFGSCSDQDKEQKLWDDILDENPNVWIWLGDNIYGDSEDVQVLEDKYNKQKSDKLYTQLTSDASVFGVWDDHDYGVNDGGKEYVSKVGSQKAFCDFLDIPENDPLRSQEGIYHTRTLHYPTLSVKIFLLDTRYFRDSIERVDGIYQANLTGTILGQAQWSWLETEMHQSNADINIIASSIQAHSEQHRWEKWANFPNERTRLYDLISDASLANPVIISGDRHIGEISKLEHNSKVIYDITSSSLTHGWSQESPEENMHRVGNIVYEENYGVLTVLKDRGNINIHARLKSDNGEIKEELQLEY